MDEANAIALQQLQKQIHSLREQFQLLYDAGNIQDEMIQTLNRRLSVLEDARLDKLHPGQT